MIDTRRYQRIIGLFGLVLVIVIAVSFLTTRGVGTAGIPAGKRLVIEQVNGSVYVPKGTGQIGRVRVSPAPIESIWGRSTRSD